MLLWGAIEIFSPQGGGVLWLRTPRPIALFDDSDVSRGGAAKPS